MNLKLLIQWEDSCLPLNLWKSPAFSQSSLPLISPFLILHLLSIFWWLGVLHPHCSSLTLMQPSTDLICFPQKHSHQAFVCITAITECLRRKKRADITSTQVPKTCLRHLLGHFHQLPAFPRDVWLSVPLFSLPPPILFQFCFLFVPRWHLFSLAYVLSPSRIKVCLNKKQSSA